MQTLLKDGRISLYLEYYIGRSETPVLDEDGNQVYYTDGAMAGKLKYKMKHARKKEILNLTDQRDISPEEIEILVSTHYPGENHNTQRAFILTLYETPSYTQQEGEETRKPPL